jgi:hypothetical protein
MVNPFDIAHLRLQIEALLRQYPDLADDEVARFDTLDGATNLREVLSDLGHRHGLLKADISGLAEYIDDLKQIAARREQRLTFLRDLIFRLMESAQLRHIKLPFVTLSLRDGGPKLIGDADPETLPDDLCHIKRTPNRVAIKAAIEAGHTVEGFVLSNAPPSLYVTK